MKPAAYPVPGVMLTALRDRFGHAALQRMISAEVVAHPRGIMRMQAVANLWDRHIVAAPSVERSA
jgi:hypothetical protein